MKVSEKGALSIYGMGRFPVTLYKEQWLKLLDMSAEEFGTSLQRTMRILKTERTDILAACTCGRSFGPPTSTSLSALTRQHCRQKVNSSLTTGEI